MRRAWLVSVLLAGCPGPAPSTQFSVRAYSAPVDHGGFVLVYHPWSADSSGRVAGRGGTAVLLPVDRFEVKCANMPCEIDGGSTVTVRAKPPAGVDHVELIIGRAGYQPARVTVAFEATERRVLVMLTPEPAR
jgi:hypothetical protein